MGTETAERTGWTVFYLHIAQEGRVTVGTVAVPDAQGAGGAIGADAFEGASRITAWHLSEARRFFGELALPAELADAARLDS